MDGGRVIADVHMPTMCIRIISKFKSGFEFLTINIVEQVNPSPECTRHPWEMAKRFDVNQMVLQAIYGDIPTDYPQYYNVL